MRASLRTPADSLWFAVAAGVVSLLAARIGAAGVGIDRAWSPLIALLVMLTAGTPIWLAVQRRLGGTLEIDVDAKKVRRCDFGRRRVVRGEWAMSELSLERVRRRRRCSDLTAVGPEGRLRFRLLHADAERVLAVFDSART